MDYGTEFVGRNAAVRDIVSSGMSVHARLIECCEVSSLINMMKRTGPRYLS